VIHGQLLKEYIKEKPKKMLKKEFQKKMEVVKERELIEVEEDAQLQKIKGKGGTKICLR